MLPIPRRGTAPRLLPSLAPLLVASLLVAGCVAIQDEGDDDITALPPVHTPAKVVPTPIPGMPGMVILDMHEEAGPEPSLVKVTGTIVNNSNQEAYRLQVRIEARDAAGRTLSRVTAPALTEAIPVGGSSAFEASMPRSNAIHDYFAEVVAR